MAVFWGFFMSLSLFLPWGLYVVYFFGYLNIFVLSISEMILLVLAIFPSVSPRTLPHHGLQIWAEFTFSESCFHGNLVCPTLWKCPLLNTVVLSVLDRFLC